MKFLTIVEKKQKQCILLNALLLFTPIELGIFGIESLEATLKKVKQFPDR